MNVLDFCPKVAKAPTDKIKETRLPKGAGRSAALIQNERGLAFEFTHDRREGVSCWLNHQVDVIRHHNVSEDLESHFRPASAQSFQLEGAFRGREARDVLR